MGGGSEPLPKTLEEYIERLLDMALDIGIAEADFWVMTPGEVSRAIQSYNRLTMRQARDKASFDYIQAQLIIKGVSIILSGKGQMPTIQETYPELFEEVIREQEEKIQERKDELSALRFKMFAQSHNNKFKNEEVLK